MQLKNSSLALLLVHLNFLFGRNIWQGYEPETIMMELGEASYELQDKIYVLKALTKDLNGAMSVPEFVVWSTHIANNEPVDMTHITLPTSLELAWFLKEVEEVAKVSEVSFEPSEELKEIVAFFLRHDGFSKPVGVFSFVPESMLVKGQSESDTELKEQAVAAYIHHMKSLSSPTPKKADINTFTRTRYSGYIIGDHLGPDSGDLDSSGDFGGDS